MMRHRHVVLTLVLLGLGCTEGQVLAPEPLEDITQASVRRDGSTEPAEDERYPTEEEFAAYGGRSTVTLSKPGGAFSSTSFAAKATAGFTWVNHAEAALKAQLIDGTGATINSNTDSRAFAYFRPVPSHTWTLAASASTLGRSCGLTGKSIANAKGELYLTRVVVGKWTPFTFFEQNVNLAGNDVTLPSCQREEGTIIWESGEGCGDGEYCRDGNGGGGDTNGGGGGPICTLWRYIVYESQNGGMTWKEVHRYYVMYC